MIYILCYNIAVQCSKFDPHFVVKWLSLIHHMAVNWLKSLINLQ